MATLSSLLGSNFEGQSGYSGYSGYSGLGLSGYSGVSGYSGTSGYSGISGYSGTSGYSGISGYSGTPSALNYWEMPVGQDGGVNNAIMSNSQYFSPAQFVAPLNADQARQFVTLSVSTSRMDATHTASTRTARWDFSIGVYGAIYTQGTGTQNQSLYSHRTYSNFFALQSSVSGNAGVNSLSITARVTYPVASGTESFSWSYTTSATRFTLQTSGVSAYFGNLIVPHEISSTFTAGEYFVNMWGTSASSFTADTTSRWVGSSAQALNMSFVLGQNVTVNFERPGNTLPNSFVPGLGSFTTNATGFNSPVAFTNISASASNPRPFYQLLNTNYTFI
jgi:hypothetical protein